MIQSAVLAAVVGTGFALAGCQDAPLREEGAAVQPRGDVDVTSSQTDYRGGAPEENVSPSRTATGGGATDEAAVGGAGAQDNVPPTGATPGDADQYFDEREPSGEGYQPIPGRGGSGTQEQAEEDFTVGAPDDPDSDEFVQGQGNLRPGFQGMDNPENAPERPLSSAPEE